MPHHPRYMRFAFTINNYDNVDIYRLNMEHIRYMVWGEGDIEFGNATFTGICGVYCKKYYEGYEKMSRNEGSNRNGEKK